MVFSFSAARLIAGLTCEKAGMVNIGIANETSALRTRALLHLGLTSGADTDNLILIALLAPSEAKNSPSPLVIAFKSTSYSLAPSTRAPEITTAYVPGNRSQVCSP